MTREELEKEIEAASDKYTWPNWPKKSDHDRPERYDTMMYYEIGYAVNEAFVDGAKEFYRRGQLAALKSEEVSQLKVKLEGVILSFQVHGQDLDPLFHIEWLRKSLVKFDALVRRLETEGEMK